MYRSMSSHVLLFTSLVLQHASAVKLKDPKPVSNATHNILKRICHDEVLPKNHIEAYHWANKNGDMRMTGASHAKVPSQLAHGPAWSFKFQEGIGNSFHPCIDDHKNIFIASRNGALRKFDGDGALQWALDVPSVVGGCALMDGAIYLGTSTGKLVAVDMKTGKERWTVKYAEAAPYDSWSLAAHSGIVIALGAGREGLDDGTHGGGGGSIVYAVDSSGTVLWNSTFGLVYNFVASFAEKPPSIIASDSQGEASRLRLCDGQVIWKSQKVAHFRAELWGTSGGSISPGNGMVYVASNVRAVSPLHAPREPPAENVFRPGEIRGVVTAYNQTHGGLIWTQTFDIPTVNAPAFGAVTPGGDPVLVVGFGDNPSHPNETAEGEGAWPDGTIVQFRSEVVALEPLTGDRTGWEFAPPDWRHTGGAGDTATHDCFQDAVSNAAIGGDGAVYFGHMDGRIYALKDRNRNGRVDKDEVSSWDGGRVDQGSPGLAPGMLVYSPCDGIHVFKDT